MWLCPLVCQAALSVVEYLTHLQRLSEDALGLSELEFQSSEDMTYFLAPARHAGRVSVLELLDAHAHHLTRENLYCRGGFTVSGQSVSG